MGFTPESGYAFILLLYRLARQLSRLYLHTRWEQLQPTQVQAHASGTLLITISPSKLHPISYTLSPIRILSLGLIPSCSGLECARLTSFELLVFLNHHHCYDDISADHSTIHPPFCLECPHTSCCRYRGVEGSRGAESTRVELEKRSSGGLLCPTGWRGRHAHGLYVSTLTMH